VSFRTVSLIGLRQILEKMVHPMGRRCGEKNNKTENNPQGARGAKPSE
jgi:hypothetical protein